MSKKLTKIKPEILELLPSYSPFETAEKSTFDEEKALRAVNFIQTCCRHTKGKLAGQLLILEPWQISYVANMFGWVMPDGNRRYIESMFFLPRKNGKSVLSAGIGNYVFFCDKEAGAEVYVAAAERDQASLCWGMARQMIELEPLMKKRCKIYTASRTIYKESDASTFKPISADAGTKHGYNAHCVLLDELHAQRDSELMDVLVTSTGAREQPLIIYLTTSDYERAGSPCNEKHDYACKVRDGVIKDERFLPCIYEASNEDDWTDPEVWAKANPNLGISISEDFLKRECARAVESPAFQNTFKRLYLNIRTESDVRWLLMDKWDNCDNNLRPEDLINKRCVAGIDLASTNDLTAFVMYFPDYRACLCSFWLPEVTAQKRAEKNRISYLEWAEQGYIELTEGNVVDYDLIRRRVNEAMEDYNILEIAIDRWNSTHLQTQLSGDGFEIIPFGQGFSSMSAPTKELEKMVLNGELTHFNNPVMRWCAGNASVEIDSAENMKPSKKKSSEKIDGIVALVMALGRAMVQEEDSGSVYEDEGLFFV